MEKRTQIIRKFVRQLPTAIAIFSFMTITGCKADEKPDVPPAPAPRPTPSVAADTIRALATAADNFCTRQLWTAVCDLHEVTDDQRLNNGHGVYAHWAGTVPAVGLKDRTAASFATIGEPVAAILVAPEGSLALPQSYLNLKLRLGANCVYLKFMGGSQYQGYIIPETGNGGGAAGLPCVANPTVTASDRVDVVAIKHPRFSHRDSVPPAARFHEAKFHGVTGLPQPLFGVKCDDRWCVLGPSNTNIRPILQAANHPNEKKWVVRGWGDMQHLGVFVSPNTPLQLSGNLEAAIIPGPATEFTSAAQFEPSFAHAATVYISGNPEGTKYDTGWGFKTGTNEIQIQKAAGQDSWTGQVVSHGQGCPSTGCLKTVRVVKENHGTNPPGIVRFRWDEADEGVWVRCADGCCKVSGY